MEEEVAKQAQQEELSDDPFSDTEDGESDEIEKELQTKKPLSVKPASKQTMINWIHAAWSHLNSRPDMVRKSFVVTGISQSLDGSEDDIVRNAYVEAEIHQAYNCEVESEDEDQEETDH